MPARADPRTKLSTSPTFPPSSSSTSLGASSLKGDDIEEELESLPADVEAKLASAVSQARRAAERALDHAPWRLAAGEPNKAPQSKGASVSAS